MKLCLTLYNDFLICKSSTFCFVSQLVNKIHLLLHNLKKKSLKIWRKRFMGLSSTSRKSSGGCMLQSLRDYTPLALTPCIFLQKWRLVSRTGTFYSTFVHFLLVDLSTGLYWHRQGVFLVHFRLCMPNIQMCPSWQELEITLCKDGH